MHRSNKMLFSARAAPTAIEEPVPDHGVFIESERSRSTAMHPGSDRVTDRL
ncbi:hypothetical protein GCM10023321_21690 [Pseudonocardia eucalypti]|uniref:Uncharacterized protein n=1 Tax=Pseudonocardia eucalypti TaxID=648755 RepID=A0ABP9PV16_9PSEU